MKTLKHVVRSSGIEGGLDEFERRCLARKEDVTLFGGKEKMHLVYRNIMSLIETVMCTPRKSGDFVLKASERGKTCVL